MIFSSLSLDADGRLRRALWSGLVSALYPIGHPCGIHSPSGASKAEQDQAANVNVHAVSDLTGQSSTTAGEGRRAASPCIRASSPTLAAVASTSASEPCITRCVDFFADLANAQGVKLLLASGMLAALFVTQVAVKADLGLRERVHRDRRGVGVTASC